MKAGVLAFALLATTKVLAAPDEAVLGKAEGYPVCERPRGGAFAEPGCLVGMLSHYSVVFPAREVPAGRYERALAPSAHEPRADIDAFLAAHRNTGLLVMRGDTILVERYQYGRQPRHRFTSMSMAKSVVGMLVGIALAEGRIRSLDQQAGEFVPALQGHPYGETPLRHLLTMSSGVKFIEAYNGNDDLHRLGRALLFHEGPGGAAALRPFGERVAPPGRRFSYSSADTFVLALALRGAAGRPLAEYLAEKLWQPMGAEEDASWNVDAAGNELGFCCLNATLRDWARLGLLLADGGAREGRQIIPAAWVRDMTRNQAPTPGYGYQTWVSLAEDRFHLRGLRGQAVDVHPATRTVVVHTGVYPVGAGRMGQPSFFDAVLKALEN